MPRSRVALAPGVVSAALFAIGFSVADRERQRAAPGNTVAITATGAIEHPVGEVLRWDDAEASRLRAHHGAGIEHFELKIGAATLKGTYGESRPVVRARGRFEFPSNIGFHWKDAPPRLPQGGIRCKCGRSLGTATARCSAGAAWSYSMRNRRRL